MEGPRASLLDGGARLHLHHGPIDLIVGADPVRAGERRAAFAAATACFDGVLGALVDELPLLRVPLTPASPAPAGPVARRMHAAALPHCDGVFVTPMAAVAGAVADEVLAAMVARVALRRAWVNDGGDIAVHLAAGERFDIAMAGLNGRDLGRVGLGAADGIGGLATSGAGGRSLSLGIADSVTVLARDAAAADVAATLIANAVDLPGHAAIRREPATSLHPDSDLGSRAVVTGVGALTQAEVAIALEAGAQIARAMYRAGHIAGGALFLRGQGVLVGTGLAIHETREEVAWK